MLANIRIGGAGSLQPCLPAHSARCCANGTGWATTAAASKLASMTRAIGDDRLDGSRAIDTIRTTGLPACERPAGHGARSGIQQLVSHARSLPNPTAGARNPLAPLPQEPGGPPAGMPGPTPEFSFNRG